MITENNLKIQKLTRKEINIVFGYLYNLERFNNYAKDYLPVDYVYDVIERGDQVQIYYENTSSWKLPISIGSLIK